VVYKGATNSRGARVLIKDLLNNKRKLIDYDYSKNNAGEIAKDYLENRGVKIEFVNEAKDGYYLLTSDFKFELN
jgi:hypothetical protein